MIKKLTATEQNFVTGGNGYKKLNDGRVLIYITGFDSWELFESWEEARTVMKWRGEQIGSFGPIRISQTTAWQIAEVLENR